ncbi:beta-soluble NSF attachment protein [Caerostris extrusa]|uniref:Beta-soluble NSF attachment protein n=1 Tax=Caerostris extrusa TaxID=172846 RepID=A0AAV4NNN0_CAEEX|nr:beta-soluble NSF attachment protein [Caerostris extrusa]
MSPSFEDSRGSIVLRKLAKCALKRKGKTETMIPEFERLAWPIPLVRRGEPDDRGRGDAEQERRHVLRLQGAGPVRGGQHAVREGGQRFQDGEGVAQGGNAFAEAASMELKNERKTEAAMHYVEAAKCYKKVSPSECETCLLKASEVYDDVGRGQNSSQAAPRLGRIL